jgi:hypothetical protein
MDRRTFLRETFMGLGVLACGVGGLLVRRTRSRRQLVGQLMDSARPILDAKALGEQDKIPARARKEIEEYFNGLIMAANDGFLTEIRSTAFRAKLHSLKKVEKRHKEVMAAFFRHVASDTDILARVRHVAHEIGPELDEHWRKCCNDIAAKWESRLHGSGIPFEPESFVDNVTPLVQRQIEQAVKEVHAGQSGWRETVRSLGEEALETGEEVRLEIGDHSIRIPEFWAKASRKVFSDSFIQALGSTKDDLQTSLNNRMLYFGREVASELEKEMRERLNKLQTWQLQAIHLSAEQQAAERIGFFGDNA